MLKIWNMIKKLNKFDILLALLGAWFVSLFVVALVSPRYVMDTGFAKVESIPRLLLLTVLFFVPVIMMAAYKRIVIFITLIGGVMLYGMYASYLTSDQYTSIGFSLLLIALLAYSYKYFELSKYFTSISGRSTLILIAVVGACSMLYVAITTVFRYTSYIAPCFDFGIFAQMFDNMRDGIGPLTTCERGELLSHFAVHFSPVYYLILPLYYIFPSPITLQVAQATVLASGIIPLALLSRKIGLSNTKTAFICVLYSIHPAVIGGCFYDIHENVFLAPLILWVMYFIEKDSKIGTLIFSLLTLGVKEDAAIYVAAIAIYLIFDRKKRVFGSALFALSVVYFLTVAYFMTRGGDGIMLGGRYYNVIGKDGEFLDLVRAVIINPAIYIIESFNASKLLFLLLIMLPFGFTCLMGTKISEYTLFIPIIVMNLVSDYQYQHDLRFQYLFGSVALLFFVAAKNLSRLKKNSQLTRILACYALGVSLLVGAARYSAQVGGVLRYYETKEEIEIIDRTLAHVDKTREIGASTMLVAHLYDVDRLYSLENYSKETECVILDLRSCSTAHESLAEVKYYQAYGYELEVYHEGIIAVLYKAPLEY